MNSKTLAVVLIVCVAQGLVNGRKFKKRATGHVKSNEDSIHSTVHTLKNFLTKMVTDFEMITSFDMCNLREDIFSNLEAQVDNCANALKNPGSVNCHSYIEKLGINFETASDFINEYPSVMMDGNFLEIGKLGLGVLNLEVHLTANDDRLKKCHEHAEIEVSTDIISCEEKLENVITATIGDIHAQCAKDPITRNTKNNNDFECHQLVSVFHLWMGLNEDEIKKCHPAPPQIKHLAHAWGSFENNLTSLIGVQKDQSECQVVQNKLIGNFGQVQGLLHEYHDQTFDSDQLLIWVENSAEVANEIYININETKKNCPNEKIQVFLNTLEYHHEEISKIQEDIYRKVEHCREKPHHSRKRRSTRSKCEELKSQLHRANERYSKEIEEFIKREFNSCLKCQACLVDVVNKVKTELSKLIERHSQEQVNAFLDVMKNILNDMKNCIPEGEINAENIEKIKRIVQQQYEIYLPQINKIVNDMKNC